MTISDVIVTYKTGCKPQKRLEVTQVTHFAEHLLYIIKLVNLAKLLLIKKVFRKVRHLNTINDLAAFLRHYFVTIASLPRTINDLVKITTISGGIGR